MVFLSAATYKRHPQGGSLLRFISLRMVGSGFRPTAQGHPRAMLALALDVSVGKAESSVLAQPQVASYKKNKLLFFLVLYVTIIAESGFKNSERCF